MSERFEGWSTTKLKWYIDSLEKKHDKEVGEAIYWVRTLKVLIDGNVTCGKKDLGEFLKKTKGIK